MRPYTSIYDCVRCVCSACSMHGLSSTIRAGTATSHRCNKKKLQINKCKACQVGALDAVHPQQIVFAFAHTHSTHVECVRSVDACFCSIRIEDFLVSRWLHHNFGNSSLSSHLNADRAGNEIFFCYMKHASFTSVATLCSEEKWFCDKQ